MKKLLLLLGSVLFCSALYAEFNIWIVVPNEKAQEVTYRLDMLIEPESRCAHYAVPHPSWVATYPYTAFLVDDRAQSVLTPEEWASRLATMPAEFVRPLPQ